MQYCACFNPLPANSLYCAIDRNDKIINSILTGTRERLCAQRFLVLERIRKLPQGGNRMNKVGNASLRTEKGCGSYTKVAKNLCVRNTKMASTAEAIFYAREPCQRSDLKI